MKLNAESIAKILCRYSNINPMYCPHCENGECSMWDTFMQEAMAVMKYVEKHNE